MLNLYYLRQVVIAAGGVGDQVSEVGLLRQLVSAYGGTPTKWEPLGLLREAITASGGTPTQVSEVGLLRELAAARGFVTALVNPNDILILLTSVPVKVLTFSDKTPLQFSDLTYLETAA